MAGSSTAVASTPRRGLARRARPHRGLGDPQDAARGRRTERSFEPHRRHHHRCSGDLTRAVATLSERGVRPCGRGRLPARLDRARPADSLRRPRASRPAARQTSPVDAGGGRPGVAHPARSHRPLTLQDWEQGRAQPTARHVPTCSSSSASRGPSNERWRRAEGRAGAAGIIPRRVPPTPFEAPRVAAISRSRWSRHVAHSCPTVACS